ncbi:MAG: type IV toxin-antitoxin system AbiEi family antitoxin [Candidatus Bipolaricaulota bacterium]|nr:type IV toxin-antitoxin system AbiEi family antitoxin [Candidatus Bipolaricaulota bacterium]
MNKSVRLGPLELELIFTLEKENLVVFRFRDAKRILQVSDSSVANVLHRLKRKNRIEELERGKYVLAPARSGIDGYWSENIYLVVDNLLEDYYIAFWAAMHYWNMTEQMPFAILVATTKRKRDLEYGGQPIKFVTISRTRFFGSVLEEVDDNKFNISSREKTIIDGLTYPQHCGGLSEVSKALWNSRDALDWNRELEFLNRLNVSSVTRRFGYLMEILEIGDGILARLPHEFTGYRWLDPSSKKQIRAYSKKWGLRLNWTREELLAWRGS